MKTLIGIALCGVLSANASASVAGSLSGVVVLDGSASGALTMSGSSVVQSPQVYVNSTANKAVTGSGSATLDTPHMYACGGCSYSGSAKCTGTTTRALAPYADPLAGVKVPAVTPTTVDLGSAAVKGGSKTLKPGFYSGGISISGGAAVTLTPGVYLIGGKGLAVSSSSISGQGVCLVLVAGGMALSGGSTVQLSPPTTGALAGVAIAQPASNTSKMALSGSSGVKISGAIYAPGAAADLSGSSSVKGEGPQFGDAIVVRLLTLSGSGTIKIGGSTAPAAAPLPSTPLFD